MGVALPGTGILPATAVVVPNNAPDPVRDAAYRLRKRLGDAILLCDGVNDQEELDAAYDYLPSGGGRIKLLAGTYTGTKLKNWTKPVWLVGPGPEICVVNTTVGANGIAISQNLNGSQIEFGGGVQGVTLRDTVGGNTRKCIYVEDTEHFVVRGCWIDNYGISIHLTGLSFLNTIEHNQLKGIAATGIQVDANVTGLLIFHNRILMADGATRGVDFNGKASYIIANYFEQAEVATNTDFIRFGANSTLTEFSHNNFDANDVVTNCVLVLAGALDIQIVHNANMLYPTAATAVSDAGTRTIIRFNSGYITEAKGASTGTGAQQTIAHGLSFTPTRQQIALIAGSATANPYHSAAPDATNIYVTAANGQAWYWATVG